MDLHFSSLHAYRRQGANCSWEDFHRLDLLSKDFYLVFLWPHLGFMELILFLSSKTLLILVHFLQWCFNFSEFYLLVLLHHPIFKHHFSPFRHLFHFDFFMMTWFIQYFMRISLTDHQMIGNITGFQKWVPCISSHLW